MPTRNPRTILETASSQLRALTFSSAEGVLLGGEPELIARLGVSRSTLRQAARLLEAEGLLSVRRGPNGGYFSARPSTETLETAFGGYLNALNLDVEETFIVGFALWVEIVREASVVSPPEIRAVAECYRERLAGIAGEASLAEVLAFEDDYRHSVFELVRRPYVEVIFMLNRGVTWRHLTVPGLGRESEMHDPAFIRAWRKCKQAEIDALEAGDETSAVLAASRDRALWYEYLFSQGGLKRRDAARRTPGAS